KIMLRQQIASNGKIVSAEDVKLVCYQTFGDMLQAVEVKKGVQAGNSITEGFLRTIDVNLTIETAAREIKSELDYLTRELDYLLQSRATLVYPFRVILQ